MLIFSQKDKKIKKLPPSVHPDSNVLVFKDKQGNSIGYISDII